MDTLKGSLTALNGTFGVNGYNTWLKNNLHIKTSKKMKQLLNSETTTDHYVVKVAFKRAGVFSHFYPQYAGDEQRIRPTLMK